jgi:hypothetical protein
MVNNAIDHSEDSTLGTSRTQVPEISLSYVSANDDVEKMILRAKINKMNPTS